MAGGTDAAAWFAFPGDLATETGGYRYDRRVIAALAEVGVSLAPVSLGNCLPGATAADVRAGGERLVGLEGDRPVIVDGLALGVMPEAAERAARQRPLVALVHHPLAEETGLAPDVAEALRTSEREALAHAHLVIAVSDATAGLLVTDYAVPMERIRIASPGIDRRPAACPDPTPPHRLIAVGALVPRKGFDVLVDAIGRLPHHDLRLVIAGDPDRDPVCRAALEHQIAAAGLQGRIRLAGKVDEETLDSLFAQSDLFVVSSHHEGYGMAVAEAIACGLPVVGTDGGALKDTIPPEVGRIVPAANAAALADAIAAVLAPHELASRAAAARRHADALPTWEQAAHTFRAVLADLGALQTIEAGTP